MTDHNEFSRIFNIITMLYFILKKRKYHFLNIKIVD